MRAEAAWPTPMFTTSARSALCCSLSTGTRTALFRLASAPSTAASSASVANGLLTTAAAPRRRHSSTVLFWTSAVTTITGGGLPRSASASRNARPSRRGISTSLLTRSNVGVDHEGQRGLRVGRLRHLVSRPLEHATQRHACQAGVVDDENASHRLREVSTPDVSDLRADTPSRWLRPRPAAASRRRPPGRPRATGRRGRPRAPLWWDESTPIERMPARRAASRPAGASSTTTQRPGASPSRSRRGQEDRRVGLAASDVVGGDDRVQVVAQARGWRAPRRCSDAGPTRRAPGGSRPRAGAPATPWRPAGPSRPCSRSSRR